VARDWTEDEVDATVADYFDMLTAELRGEVYVKAEHRRALLPLLNGRSEGSVERKHQNISAVLIGLGLPYISGYKPLGNYQGLLAQEVERFVGQHPDVLGLVEADVDRPAEVLPEVDFLSVLVEAPMAKDFVPGIMQDAAAGFSSSRPVRTNYLERESRNRSLGLLGEEFVLEYERERLARVGDGALADRVEHVSQTLGDGAGYDIRSFDGGGDDLFIEVKTTRYGRSTPFFVSSNELGFSRVKHNSYGLYRVFEYERDAKLFVLPGAIDKRCAMRPQVYKAWPPQAS